MLGVVAVIFVSLTCVHSKLILAPGMDGDAVGACPFAVDIANVVDTSYSQFDNLAGLKTNLTAAMQYMEAKHPSSKAALTVFTDKPIVPLGWDEPRWKDFCARVITDFSGAPENMQIELNKLRVGGGYDFPEAQMEAVLRTALSGQLEWRGDYLETGEPIIHVILLVTDSLPHGPGDAARAVEAWKETHPDNEMPVPRPNDLNTNYTGLHDDINFECSLVDYPSVKEVGNVLMRRNIIPIIMTTPSGWDCGEEKLCPYPEMEELAMLTGIAAIADPYLGLPIVYEAALQEMGVTGIVEPLMLESENFYEKFVEVLDQLQLIPKDCFTTTTTASTDLLCTDSTITGSEVSDLPDCTPEESTEPECIPGTTTEGCEEGVKIHINIKIDGGCC